VLDAFQGPAVLIERARNIRIATNRCGRLLHTFLGGRDALLRPSRSARLPTKGSAQPNGHYVAECLILETVIPQRQPTSAAEPRLLVGSRLPHGRVLGSAMWIATWENSDASWRRR
jgi:hypothetical protein